MSPLPSLRQVFDNRERALREWLPANFNPPAQVASFIAPRVKRVEEFRVRAQPGQRSGAMETMTGLESASILLNLKNHRQPAERARYQQILDAFRTCWG
jgi:hypothetical protein